MGDSFPSKFERVDELNQEFVITMQGESKAWIHSVESSMATYRKMKLRTP